MCDLERFSKVQSHMITIIICNVYMYYHVYVCLIIYHNADHAVLIIICMLHMLDDAMYIDFMYFGHDQNK